MAQATGGDDPLITDFRAPVAPDVAQDVAPGMMTGWPWAVLVAGMLVLGGTNVAYPLMRALAGTLGGVALAAAITSRKSLWPRPDWTDGIVAGLIALFVLQLIPLPPALWTLLPGREAIAAIDREVFGQLLWRPISIDSEATWQTFAFLIPFLGTWLAFRSGDAVRRAGMVKGVWIGFALAAGLGLLQLAGFDFLHPFPIEADNQFSNGFFTNHNHQATFLLMAALLGAGHMRNLPRGSVDGRLIALAIAVSLATIASGSRAGFALMIVSLAAIAAVWLAVRTGIFRAGARFRRPAILAAGAAVLALFAVTAMIIGANRFTLGRGALSEDQRLEIAPIAWRAIGQFWPLGSGFGTFQVPFRQVEPIEALRILDIMHAHNDILESLIEGGIAALFLMLAMAVRIGWLARRGWLAGGEAGLRTGLTALALAIPLVHSLVDYPLRTMSVSVLFALALASLQVKAGAMATANDFASAKTKA